MEWATGRTIITKVKLAFSGETDSYQGYNGKSLLYIWIKFGIQMHLSDEGRVRFKLTVIPLPPMRKLGWARLLSKVIGQIF